MKVVLASASNIKLRAVRRLWPNVVGCDVSSATQLPAQPVNSGLRCAHARLDALLAAHDADLYLALENGIDTIDYAELGGDAQHFCDVCYAVAQRGRDGERREAASFGIPISKAIVAAARSATEPNYAQRDLGYAVTAGELLQRAHGVDAANWMADARFGGVDRAVQILDALEQIQLALKK